MWSILSKNKNHTLRKVIFITILGWLICLSLPKFGYGNTIKILSASSFKPLLTEAIINFKKTNPNINFIIDTQGSQILKFQIQHGVLADIFFSADISYIDDILKMGLIDVANNGILCKNEMVLLKYKHSLVKINDITDIGYKKINLILGVKSSPFGYYAQEIIKKITAIGHHNFLEGLQANLISLESNVGNAVGKVRFGLADATIAYKSDFYANSNNLVLITILDKYQPDIFYGYAILKASLVKHDAKKFIAYLTLEARKKIFTKYGFIPLLED